MDWRSNSSIQGWFLTTARAAECASLPGLILARNRAVEITPAAIKTSAGPWVHLRIAQCGNVVQILERLIEMDYWVAALAPEGEVGLYELDVSRRLAIVVGAEGEGLRRQVKEKADVLVKSRGRADCVAQRGGRNNNRAVRDWPPPRRHRDGQVMRLLQRGLRSRRA